MRLSPKVGKNDGLRSVLINSFSASSTSSELFDSIRIRLAVIQTDAKLLHNACIPDANLDAVWRFSSNHGSR